MQHTNAEEWVEAKDFHALAPIRNFFEKRKKKDEASIREAASQNQELSKMEERITDNYPFTRA
jgi:type III secretory pathway component EscR